MWSTLMQSDRQSTSHLVSRRKMIAAGAAAMATPALLAGADEVRAAPKEGQAPAEAGGDYRPVVTPNGATLPFKVVDGVKVFHLIAEPLKHEIAPGLVIDAWGYNGRTPGPTFEVVEGDRIRIYLTNRLPEPTSLHCHGVLLPNGMDGVSGLTPKKNGGGGGVADARSNRLRGAQQ